MAIEMETQQSPTPDQINNQYALNFIYGVEEERETSIDILYKSPSSTISFNENLSPWQLTNEQISKRVSSLLLVIKISDSEENYYI